MKAREERKHEIEREDEKRRELLFSRERSELSIFLITLHAPLSTILKRTLSWYFSLGSYRQPTTHNLQRISRVHTPSAGACRHPSARGDLRSKAEERRFEALLGGWTEKNGSGVWSLGSGKNERNETLSRPLFISFSFAP